ncbi:MAG: 3-hydroxyacyl-CoA dehydrogenase [Candidatus Pelagadaptatus aseana]|uniref:SDR family NAD(P)-dependent oxidoreductase n=1 Tax=Candidatus Pelagadaptatus aseana TaxID=3120508 RepID=UPI0039B31663
MDLQDKVALITGGASGLGRATAQALVSKGAKVFLFDLNEDACKATVAELGSDNCAYAIADVTDEDSVNAGLDQAMTAFGKLHIVLNSAGIGPPCKVLDREGNPLPLAKFKKIVDVNMNGTFNVLSKAAALMAKQDTINDDGGRGVIINVASVAAFDGQIGQPAYGGSKSGIVGMTLPIARELAYHGIRINCIAPGLFHTELAMTLDDKVIEALGNSVEFPKRLGKPSEFAQLVVQMAENDYFNGEVVRLDGSIRMKAR